jgi:small conductance mechanosensitive channel
LGFAFQDIAANFVSGIILAFHRPFRVGDIIETNGIEGIVARTDLRVTIIHTYQGQEISVPNKDVLQSALTNFSIKGERRIDLMVGISYGDDLDKVEDLMRDVIGSMEGIIRAEDVIFSYEAFGDSSINFMVSFWIKYNKHTDFLSARNKAIKEIKSAFDDNYITIPFPIRTLDFGIKGGKTLSEMQISSQKTP